MAPEKDEILKRFGDSLKDLKKLRKQLYSAADCLESSYKKPNHKQFVVESSREYVAKALVSTVDHLGSAAHKLNKFLDEKATQFSATTIQLSLIQQRLSTIQGLTGVSHKLEAETLGSGVLLSCETSVKKETRMKQLCPPMLRKEESRKAPPTFSFTRMAPEKGPERRSVSPLRFLSGSVIKRPVSPTPSVNKGRWASAPRRAISAGKTRQDASWESLKETEESYTKRSKHLFKALLSLHHSKKDTTLSTLKSLPKPGSPP